MVLRSWLQMFRARLWWHARLSRKRKKAKRRAAQRLATRVLSPEDRTLLFGVTDDTVSMTNDAGPVQVSVLSNDDLTGGPVEIISFTQPISGGSVSLIDDPSGPGTDQLQFTVDPGYTGNVTFTYTAQDASGNQAAASVSVDVTARPTISNLGLVNDTETPDDLVTSDPRISYTLNDADPSSYYYVEVDTNGDGSADLTDSAYGPGTYQQDLSGSLGYGTHTIAVRAIEYPESGPSHTGDWTTLTFTYAPPPNDPPVIENLGLVNDTDTPDDLSTSDPRIGFTLTDINPSYYYDLQFDTNGDGSADFTNYAYGTGTYEQNLGEYLGYGTYTIGVRAVEYPETGAPSVASNWTSLTFTYAPPPNDPPVIENLELINDTDTPDDLSTSDPRIGFTLTDVNPSYYYDLQFDTNGDGNADFTSYAYGTGTYEQNLGEYLGFGTYTVAVRAVEYPDMAPSVTGDWTTLTFTYAPPPNDPPVIENLGLVNDTGTIGDLVTSDSRIRFTLTDLNPSFYYYIEVDANGDGYTDIWNYASGPGTYEQDLSGYLWYGTQTVSVRASEYPDMAPSVTGAWTTLMFTLEPPHNSAPTITSLALINDTGTPNDLTTSDGRIGFVLQDTSPSYYYDLQFDLNGDGSADFAEYAYGPDTYQQDLSSYLGYGTHTIAVRAIEYPDMAPSVTGEWISLTFTFAPPPNDPPVIANLGLVNDPDADLSTSDPRIEFTLTDVNPSFYYELQFDTNGDGSAEFTDTAYGPGTYQQDLSGYLGYEAYTISVRAVEYPDSGAPSVTGEWATLTFTLAPFQNDSPTIADVRLANDTATPGDLITSDPRLRFTLQDPDPGSSYGLEIDINGDGSADIWSAVSGTGEHEFDLSSHIGFGGHTVAIRAIEYLDSGSSVTSEWTSLSFTYYSSLNSAPITVADLYTMTAGSTILIDPTVNDWDPDGDSLTLVSVSTDFGTVQLRPRISDLQWQEWLAADDGTYASFADWWDSTSHAMEQGFASELPYDVELTITGSEVTGQATVTYGVADPFGAVSYGTAIVTVLPPTDGSDGGAQDDTSDTIDEIIDDLIDQLNGTTGGSGGTTTPPSGEGTVTDGGGVSSSQGTYSFSSADWTLAQGSGASGYWAIGGVSEDPSAPSADEMPTDVSEPGVEDSLNTSMTLESGLVVDLRTNFVLPVELQVDSEVTTTGVLPIDETVDTSGVTLTSVGSTSWTLTVLTALTTEGWVYAETYTSTSMVTVTGSDGSMSVHTTTYDYAFAAEQTSSQSTFTLSFHLVEEATGSFDEIWETPASVPGGEGETESPPPVGSGVVHWLWSLTSSNDSSFTYTADQSSGATTLVSWASTSSDSSMAGQGTYTVALPGGLLSGTSVITNSASETQVLHITETLGADGIWVITAGTASGSGSSELTSQYAAVGNYQAISATSDVTGAVTESGAASSSVSYDFAADYASDGTWTPTAGNLQFAGDSTASYAYSGSGTFYDTTSLDATAIGTVVESGGFSLADSYSGSALVGADGLWQGTMTATGSQSAMFRLRTGGTYGAEEMSGVMENVVDQADSTTYAFAAGLDAIGDWKLASGESQSTGISDYRSMYSGTGTYSRDLAQQATDGSTSTDGGETTETTETEGLTSNKSGTVSGVLSEYQDFGSTTTSEVTQVAGTDGNWAAAAGTSSTITTVNSAFAYSGAGTYSAEISGGTVDGTVTESGHINSSVSIVEHAALDLSGAWQFTDGTIDISGDSRFDDAYSGTGQFTLSDTDTVASGTYGESAKSYWEDQYMAQGIMVLPPPPPASSDPAGEEGSTTTEASSGSEYSWNWTAGSATEKSGYDYALAMESAGTVTTSLDGGSLSGTTKDHVKFSAGEDVEIFQTILEDGTWQVASGTRNAYDTFDLSYLMAASSQVDTPAVGMDVTLQTTLATEYGEKASTTTSETLLADGTWQLATGDKSEWSLETFDSLTKGAGTVVSSGVTVEVAIEAHASDFFHRDRKQAVVDGVWQSTEGQRTDSTSSDFHVGVLGGGLLDAAGMPVTVTVTGDESQTSNTIAFYRPSLEGEWILINGSEEDTYSSAFGLTVAANQTGTLPVTEGTLGTEISFVASYADAEFERTERHAAGGGATLSSTGQSLGTESAEWSALTGERTFYRSATTAFIVSATGSLTAADGATADLQLSIEDGYAFTESARYTVTPPSTDESTESSLAEAPFWTPAEGARADDLWHTESIVMMISDTSDVQVAGGTTTVTTDVGISITASNQTHIDYSLASDDTWLLVGGTQQMVLSSQLQLEYLGAGTFTHETPKGTIVGTTSLAGTASDVRTWSRDLTMDSTGTVSVTAGVTAVDVHTQDKFSLAGAGTYTYETQGGSVSGESTESVVRESSYDEYYLATLVPGNASWNYIGSKTSISSGSSDFAYSGSGTYSWTQSTGSGRQSSVSGTITEFGAQHEETAQSQLFDVNLFDGSWESGVGQLTSSGHTADSLFYTGSGSYQVDSTDVEQDYYSGATQTVINQGSGQITEAGYVLSASQHETSAIPTVDGSWQSTVDQGTGSTTSGYWQQASGTINTSYAEQGSERNNQYSGTTTEFSRYESADLTTSAYDDLLETSLQTKWSSFASKDTSNFAGDGTFSKTLPSEQISGSIDLVTIKSSREESKSESWVSPGDNIWLQAVGAHHFDWSDSYFMDSSGAGTFQAQRKVGNLSISVSGNVTDVTSTYGEAHTETWDDSYQDGAWQRDSGTKTSTYNSESSRKLDGTGTVTMTLYSPFQGTLSGDYVETHDAYEKTRNSEKYAADGYNWDLTYGDYYSKSDLKHTGTVASISGSYSHNGLNGTGSGTASLTDQASGTATKQWSPETKQWEHAGSGTATHSDYSEITLTAQAEQSSTPDPWTNGVESSTSSAHQVLEEEIISRDDHSWSAPWSIGTSGTKSTWYLSTDTTSEQWTYRSNYSNTSTWTGPYTTGGFAELDAQFSGASGGELLLTHSSGNSSSDTRSGHDQQTRSVTAHATQAYADWSAGQSIPDEAWGVSEQRTVSSGTRDHTFSSQGTDTLTLTDGQQQATLAQSSWHHGTTHDEHTTTEDWLVGYTVREVSGSLTESAGTAPGEEPPAQPAHTAASAYAYSDAGSGFAPEFYFGHDFQPASVPAFQLNATAANVPGKVLLGPEPTVTQAFFNGLGQGAANIGYAAGQIGHGIYQTGLQAKDTLGVTGELLGLIERYECVSELGQAGDVGAVTAADFYSLSTFAGMIPGVSLGQSTVAWWKGEISDDEYSVAWASFGFETLMMAGGLRGTTIGTAPLRQVPQIAITEAKAAVGNVVNKTKQFFGARRGAVTMAEGSPAWAGPMVREYANSVPAIDGFTDVFIHGTRNGRAFSVIHNGQEVILSHRQIAGWLQSQGIEGNVRLISCYSGSLPTGGVAQNLANKLGVTVRAPTNAITVHFNGSLTAPPGTRWRDLVPGGR
ncbi:MAG: hypothetical protein KDA90_06940 [Planctomycetaceae bacterium]|nr:hypothetical protein [Planctomycetaceae bacterium]